MKKREAQPKLYFPIKINKKTKKNWNNLHNNKLSKLLRVCLVCKKYFLFSFYRNHFHFQVFYILPWALTVTHPLSNQFSPLNRHATLHLLTGKSAICSSLSSTLEIRKYKKINKLKIKSKPNNNKIFIMLTWKMLDPVFLFIKYNLTKSYL